MHGSLLKNLEQTSYSLMILKDFKNLEQTSYSLHGSKHFSYHLKIKWWPDINVALFAIVTKVCCFIILSQNVK